MVGMDEIDEMKENIDSNLDDINKRMKKMDESIAKLEDLFKRSYCIGCGEKISGDIYHPYCPNEECNRYALVTTMVNLRSKAKKKITGKNVRIDIAKRKIERQVKDK